MKTRSFAVGVMLTAILAACTSAPGVPSSPGNSASAPTSTNSQILNQNSAPGMAVRTLDANYFENTKGFFAQPDKEGSYPGIIMIHEWWGLNDQIKDTARMLAARGYNVLAVDLYNGFVAKTPEEARAQVSSLDQAKALQNMAAAKAYLKDKGATKLASWGWCFGGGQSMQLALNDTELAATVIYYGNLVDDETKLQNIKWPVLGIFGDKDQSITVDKVRSFETALKKVGITNEIYVYPGVGHAFANPSGQSYAPNETKDAWEKTLKFLEKYVKEA